MMAAVVLDRDLFPFIRHVRVLDPAAGLVEHGDVDSRFGQPVADQEQPEFGFFGGIRAGTDQGAGPHGAPVARSPSLSFEISVKVSERDQGIPALEQEVAGNHQIIET